MTAPREGEHKSYQGRNVMDVVIDELNDMLNLKMREKIKNYHLIFFRS